MGPVPNALPLIGEGVDPVKTPSTRNLTIFDGQTLSSDDPG